ncbi:MFS transporter [Pseudoxanthomonas koreensis]
MTAALYAGAGILFIIGAIQGGRPGFSTVGVAFIVLGFAIWRRNRKPD